MAYQTLASSEVDAESPLDDDLLQKIKDNFDDHESRLLTQKSYPLSWVVNGDLSSLVAVKSKYKRLDGNRIVTAQTMTSCNLCLDYPGTSGTLEVDIRKYRPRNDLINSIISLFTGSITSIAQVAPALATQSIARSTAQINTQSITLFKAALNVQSIIELGSDLVRYNLDAAVDASAFKVGYTVTTASCTTGANNGSFVIVRVNDDGGNNVVVTNASGVAQTGAAGTLTLRMYSYNYTNPVSSEFAVGEQVTFASHTSGGNDGGTDIFAVNSGGNNIVIHNPSGSVQAGVAGTADCNRWVFAFSTAASTTDFIVGESAAMSGHTNAANNGNFRITAVNSGGNNIIVYNGTPGVVQGGAAGTVNTNRWVYALGSDPSSAFSAGQYMVSTSATNANNNGAFVVKEVKRGGTNNLVVYNLSGVAQAGSAGTVTHGHMVITLASDLSAVYTTLSNIEVYGSPSSGNNGFFDVVAVNSGGNNVVVLNTSGALQSSPAGRIITESKSIFSTRPSITFPTTGETAYNNTTLATQTTAPVFHGTHATISAAEVSAGVSLGMDIVSIPSGLTTQVPTTLTVQVS